MQNIYKERYKDYIINVASTQDKSVILDLLINFPPMGFLTLCSKKFITCFSKYIISSPLGVVVFAYDSVNNCGAGYVLSVRNSFAFWCKFILTYPLLAPELLVRKRKTLFSNITDGHLVSHDKGLTDFSWSPSRKEVARIIFVGIVPAYQGKGLGQAMYAFLASTLQKMGCEKIEAHIDKDNAASVALHIRNGWHVDELKHGDYKAVIELEKE